MNILLSAFECNPYRGSDSYVGWSYARSLSQLHTVYVLTRNANKTDIEGYFNSHKDELRNLHFVYVDQSRLFTDVLYKVNRYLGFLGSYFVWQRKAYLTAKKIQKDMKIDVCHHVSIADFRCAGYLWKLNVPYIFGPVGGARDTFLFHGLC